MTERDDIFAAIAAGLPVFVGVPGPRSEVCPSAEAPIRGGAPRAFPSHTFRWSTKRCAHCGLELVSFDGAVFQFEHGDAPTAEEWDAYAGPFERRGLPCR